MTQSCEKMHSCDDVAASGAGASLLPAAGAAAPDTMTAGTTMAKNCTSGCHAAGMRQPAQEACSSTPLPVDGAPRAAVAAGAGGGSSAETSASAKT